MSTTQSSQGANEDAYGRRHRARAKTRHLLRRVTRRLGNSFTEALPPGTRFIPVPEPSDAELNDFAARTTWYLGTWSTSRPTGRTREPSVPNYLDQDINPQTSERPPTGGGPAHALVWRVTPRTYLRAITRPSTTTIVDPSFAKDVDTEGYLAVGRRLGRAVPTDFVSAQLAPPSDRSTASALVLGTGPSAGDLQGEHTDWTYRIVCNSAIRDEALMERLRPTHICFGDPVFHFGPSAYAAAFRHDLRRVAETYDSILVVPGYCAALLAANMPWARGRLLPLELTSPSWHAPTLDERTVRITGNVLTQQMVPLAISLASAVDVGGADGRKPEEKYFWTHSKRHQYSDQLMNSAFEAHPAFFRDTDYADYYADHCEAVEQLISYGEDRGCTFRTVTKSYIPALASRMPGALGLDRATLSRTENGERDETSD